jgi:hypothetical protein
MANSNITIDSTLDSLMMTPTTTCTFPRMKKNTKVILATEDTRTKKGDPHPSQEEITPSSAPKKIKSKEKNDQNDVELIRTNTKKKNPNWTVEEDKELCAAWLKTSRDSVVGIGQKGATFWDRVHKLCTDPVEEVNKERKHMKKVKPLPVQFPNAVKCCCGHIMKVCNKFGGRYSQVECQLASGRTCDDDIVSNIIQIQLFFTIADFFLFSLPKPKSSIKPITIMHSILTIAGGY